MSIAFLTMVWRDHWLLQKWVDHNSTLVPRCNLYVINHGGDPEVDRIAEGCNLIHVPRSEIAPDLTRRRWTLLGNFTNGLQAFHDHVICTDVDELLLYVGGEPDLLAHLAKASQESDAISPVGLNIIPTAEDGTDMSQTVLQRHPNAIVNAKYTKPCISRKPVRYTVGGHGLVKGTFRIDPEILLFHLHYVTPDYAERMAARRDIVRESREVNAALDQPIELPGRYWINWSKPDVIRDKEMEIFGRARLVDVSDGFGECAAHLRAAVHTVARKTVVEPAAVTKNPLRVEVPPALRARL